MDHHPNHLLALLALCSLRLLAGTGFDTGVSPEQAAALLAPEPGGIACKQAPTRVGDSLGDGRDAAAADSWLRLRGMAESAVIDDAGREIPVVPDTHPPVSVAGRRLALEALRAHGYRLVALLRWDDATWQRGVRDPKGLRQLPLDLREAFGRCRLLAATYGGLIDYWEIDNEPDIGYVEENPETYAAFLKACCLGIRAGAAEKAETLKAEVLRSAKPEAAAPLQNEGSSALLSPRSPVEEKQIAVGEGNNGTVGSSLADGPSTRPVGSSLADGPSTRPVGSSLADGPSTRPVGSSLADGPSTRPVGSSLADGPSTQPVGSSLADGPSTQPVGSSLADGPCARPLVLMGALALPPGPYFEAFATNQGLSYTDGFNYHYYGYAEDFTAPKPQNPKTPSYGDSAYSKNKVQILKLQFKLMKRNITIFPLLLVAILFFELSVQQTALLPDGSNCTTSTQCLTSSC